MNYYYNYKGYIEGINYGSTNNYETDKELEPLFLPTGEPRYQIVDNELIETPFDWETYNQEQSKKERDAKIVSAIREIYSIDDEYKLINLGIADNRDPEYLEYRQTVEKIKQEVTMQ